MKRHDVHGGCSFFTVGLVQFHVCQINEERIGYVESLIEDELLRLEDLERDRDADKARVCPSCDDTGFMECPEAEFDDHDPEVCSWNCGGEAVPCPCAPRTDARTFADERFDDETDAFADLVDDVEAIADGFLLADAA